MFPLSCARVGAQMSVEPCAALAAPPPTFGDRRVAAATAAADILSARRRCDFGCVYFFDD